MNTYRPVVRLAGWLALALFIAACSSSGQPGSPEGQAVVDSARVSTAGNPEIYPSVAAVLEATTETDPISSPGDGETRGILKTKFESFAPEVTGPFGVADTLLYDAYQTDGSLSDRPYDTGGDAVFEGYFNFYKPADPTDIVALSRLVVRGEIVGFGRPHFNSTGGEYWSPAYHEEPGVVDVALQVYREVMLRIDEVLGDSMETGLEPGTEIVFTTRGGQVRVTPAEVARVRSQARPAEHGFAPTNPFVISDPSPVNLTVGENVVLFLNWRSIDGLYDGQYGFTFELFPANEKLYKFRIDDAQLVNDVIGAAIPLDQLTKLIRDRLGKWGGRSLSPEFMQLSDTPRYRPKKKANPTCRLLMNRRMTTANKNPYTLHTQYGVTETES